MEPLVNGPGLMRAHRGAQLRPAFTATEFSFEVIKMLDLTQEPACDWRVLFARFVDFPPCVSPTCGQLDVLSASGKTGVRGIPIALDRALKIDRQDIVQARRRTAGFPMIDDVSTGTRGGPKVAGLGF